MKKTIITILQLQLVTPTLPAAVPLRWTVETSRVQPAVFEAYQGETLTFEAALQSHGKPLAAPVNYSFFWQTNGMGSTYWEAPAQRGSGVSPLESGSVVSPLERGSGVSPLVGETNVLFATWLPAYDVGARAYNCFIGSPSNIYHAAFQLRLRPSPGALPNALPLPTPVIDFARVRVLNPPWGSGGGGGCDTNAVDALANSAVVTNALTVATTNRVAALETATNNLSSSVSSLAFSKADKAALNAHTTNTNNPHAVTAEQVGSVPFVEDVNSNKTAVTIGRRTGDVGPNSLANGNGIAASGHFSHAEGYNTTASGHFSHAEGFRTTASGIYSHAEGISAVAAGDFSHAEGLHAHTKNKDLYAFAWNGDKTRTTPYESHGPGTFNINPLGGLDGFYIGDNNLSSIILGSVTNNISATNPTFSNAVLAVQISTNDFAALYALKEAFADLPIDPVTGGISIGALLAALASAVAWLKKNKVGSFASVGGASATVENGVAKLDDFFTESNSLLISTIAANSARLALDEEGEIIVTMNTED